jgi:hypothetical protein
MIVEFTAAAVATATTNALTAYLTKAGDEAAKALGQQAVDATKGLLGWLWERLSGSAKEALGDLRIEPSEQTTAGFRRELEAVLAGDAGLLRELRERLAASPDIIRFGDQAVTVIGDQNKTGVGQGKDITISIR